MAQANGTGNNGVERHDAPSDAKHVRTLGAEAQRRPKSVPPPRRRGEVADEAQLRARIDLSRALGDVTEESAVSQKLAERLAAADVELDVAIDLATKTLARTADDVLRHELASWLERVGEPGLAASELRKILSKAEGANAAALLVRIGVLHARAGDSEGAQEALIEASELDQADALPLELLGAVSAGIASSGGVAGGAEGAGTADPFETFDPGTRARARRVGGEAYVRAARRRAAAGDEGAELEDMLRAFEVDPASPLVAAALVGAYQVREKASAADDVLRSHGDALARAGKTEEATEVHARRRTSAAEAGDASHALVAALDEALDGVFDGAGADAFDELLAKSGAFEVLAVRLEVRAEGESSPRTAAGRWAELGRLLGGPLASPELAAEAYARSVASDATRTESVQALRVLADRIGDRTWLVEGLVRGALGPSAYGSSEEIDSRAAAARTLGAVADEIGDMALAAWAFAHAARLDPTDLGARGSVVRLSSVVQRRDEEIARARKALDGASGDERQAALGTLASLLRSSPDASQELAGVLAEMSRARLDDDALFQEALRIAERVGAFDLAIDLARDRLVRSESSRVRGALASLLRRGGQAEASAAVSRALAENPAVRWTCSVAWVSSALANDREGRARALAAAAPTLPPAMARAASAVAAAELDAVGDPAAARRAAEQACRADPKNVRALCVIASAAVGNDARLAQGALERAIDVAGPTADLCTKLADVLEGVGRHAEAVAWAKRLVALRPGDVGAMQSLIDRATRAADTSSLAEALGWLVAQPEPARETARRVAPALRELAGRDAAKAAAIAARALDALGPREVSLRQAIEHVAVAANDEPLRARLLERWIAAGAPAAERGPTLLTIAARYRAIGDVDRELRALLRASREKADLVSVRERIEELRTVQRSPDGDLAWLEIAAELAAAEGRSEEASGLYRELGAALWDAADDRPRAVTAWLRAAHCDSSRGYATLRADLALFADPQYAVDCLVELFEREHDRTRSGVIAAEAARAAIEVGAFGRALGLAKNALDRDPTRAEALASAETASMHVGRAPEMSPIYDIVARRSLGRFGRRAAHHRAARFFEASGSTMLALKHAAQAFIAVPSEGSTLGLLQRTATKAQRVGVAVRTVEHVAELSRGKEARAGWILRAAAMTTRDLEGTRQRVDLLLKAAVLSGAPTTLGMLAAAAREVVSLAPEDSDAIAMRLERASETLAKKLEGPDGARMAITFAHIALDLFKDGEWAWRAIETAVSADADVDEYTRLVPYVEVLAHAREASESLSRIFAEVEKPYANVGHALLRLMGAIARAQDDAPRSARAYVRAAEKEPDDDQIVVEADAAIVLHPDEALLERLSRKVGVFRRTEALRAVAKRMADDGTHEAAVPLLERANVIAPAEAKDDVAKELGAALMASGRGDDAVLRELARPDMSKTERADLWARLAEIRTERADASGAADALLQAATEEPSVARWTAVETSAEASGREHIRVEALQHLVKLTADTERLEAMKRLARAEGARGSLAAAESAWRDVWSVDPNDAEADVALEALLVARQSYEELADHLARRAARLAADESAPKETLRAVRLRRAAILEQRLTRLEDACAELESVLRENPGHPSALRWIADLYERTNEPAKALPALDVLFANASEEIEFSSFGVRRARAFVAKGEMGLARAALNELQSRMPGALAVAELRVEIARAGQDAKELGSALADLARVSVDDTRVRSELLVEAAQMAARAGDSDTSLARAQEAAQLAPDVAATQLFARGLEYRLRGAGTVEEARATIAYLANLRADAELEPEDIALKAFLVAEAEDVVNGVESGERVLRGLAERAAEQPLIALGLAERAAKAGRHEDAVRLFLPAVYGNLLGLRDAGQVALAAAESALACGHEEAVLRFLNEAAKDTSTRIVALRKLAEVSLVRNDLARARSVLRGLADATSGDEKAGFLADLARALFASTQPAERIEADRTMREAMSVASSELAQTLKSELENHRGRNPTASEAPPAAVSAPPAAPPRAPSGEMALPEIPPAPAVLLASPSEPVQSVRHPALGATRPSESAPPEKPMFIEPTPPPALVILSSAPPPPPSLTAKPAMDLVAEARAKIARGANEEAEKTLSDALRRGSIEAADLLDELISREPARHATLLKVRRQAAELAPGDTDRLVRLRDAAKADQNLNYVRAIEHVLRAFDVAAAVTPPPLSAQSAQPGMLTLLTRHSREPAGEAFATVWESTGGMYVKQPAEYGASGLERVMPGPASTLSRLYDVALRLLDTPRSALYHQRDPRGAARGQHGGTTPSFTVALLATPSAVFYGDARDDGTDVRWVLGQALSGVLPENALVLGLPRSDAKTLWEVLVGAFGPPARQSLSRSHAQLAELLWQTLSARAQRRLKELLASGEDTAFDLVMERAKQSGRRVGMFLSGDFAHAARSVVSEHGGPAADLAQPGGLARLARELPALADLYRLAIRPEYADARWHVPTPTQRLSAGRIPIV